MSLSKRASSSPSPTAKKRVAIQSKLKKTLSIDGAEYKESFRFNCGNDVPVYEVSTVHALNQIIGYAKFNNQSYGNVYYRGEWRLHKSIKPSIFRDCKIIEKASDRLASIIKKISSDPQMQNEIKVKPYSKDDKSKIEGLLQHYGIPTRFIDVVDNHWIALWMGLHKLEKQKRLNQFYHYSKRSIPLVEFAKGTPVSDELLFQYILLIAVPFAERNSCSGIRKSTNYLEVDLRQALPSIFLRPHAQHGLVIRRIVHTDTDGSSPDAYDIAPAVIGIIKIRIDRAREWLGDGSLLTQDNLFPPPAYDHGYDLLLSRSDLFEETDCTIARFV